MYPRTILPRRFHFPSPLPHYRPNPPHRHQSSLPPLSTTQQHALRILTKTHKSMIINACAGSGKTTTILQLAVWAPERKFLVLLYNNRLMEETQARMLKLGLEKRMAVYNYHTLGSRFYRADCATDEGLKRVVYDDMAVRVALPKFDVLVMDEQQDMTPLIHRFVKKLLRDSGSKRNEVQLCLLGDPRQEVYGFNNSDSRFLTMGDHKDIFGYFAGSGDKFWARIDVKKSYRCTPEIAKLVNEQALKPDLGNEILAIANNKQNPKPRYLICDASKHSQNEVLRLMKSEGLRPDQILVLAPSIKGGRLGGKLRGVPVKELANSLALSGIPIHINPDNDDIAVSEASKAGKIMFLTYHQGKGIEREAAVVFNFDESYYRYYNRNPKTKASASNPLYVALTRAMKHLVVIHDHKYNYLPFVNQDTLKASSDVIILQSLTPIPVREHKRTVRYFSTTDLTTRVPDELMADCMDALELIPVAKSGRRACPEVEVASALGNGLVESVADITGTAIPAIYEWHTRKTCKAFSTVFHQLQSPSEMDHALKILPQVYIDKMREIAIRMENKTMTTPEILYIANIDMARRSGLVWKVLSIPFDGYTWITDEVKKIICRKLKLIPRSEIHYEMGISRAFKVPVGESRKLNEVKVDGSIDVCMPEKNIVWEVKTGIFKPEDFLQLAVYAEILEHNTGNREGSYYMIHALTGQTIQIKPKSKKALTEIVRKLITAKMEEGKPVDFFEQVRANPVRPALPSWINIQLHKT